MNQGLSALPVKIAKEEMLPVDFHPPIGRRKDTATRPPPRSRSGNAAVRLRPDWEWHARWNSYWFGDRELFDFSPRDFDRRASRDWWPGCSPVMAG